MELSTPVAAYGYQRDPRCLEVLAPQVDEYAVYQRGSLVDEVYDATVVRPTIRGSRAVLWRGVDTAIIDGIVNGTGSRARDLGNLLRRIQSGNIRSYATWVLFGCVLLLVAAHLTGAGL